MRSNGPGFGRRSFSTVDFDDLKRRFRGKSVRPVRETAVEEYLFRRARAAGFRAVKFSDPSFDGAPDRIVLGPGAFVEFVETKTPSGTLSPGQRLYHSELRRNGFRVRIIRTREEVDEFVEFLRLL